MGLTAKKWGCRWTARTSDSLDLAHKFVTVVFRSQVGSPAPLNPTIFPRLRNIWKSKIDPAPPLPPEWCMTGVCGTEPATSGGAVRSDSEAMWLHGFAELQHMALRGERM